MSSDSDLPEIFFATHNLHKSSEVGALLSGLYRVKNLSDLNLIEGIPETGKTLEENSLIKASYLYNEFGISCFADDTGLEVDALNGAPGVRSARYSGEAGNDRKNVDLLLKNLKDVISREARFRTVITLILDGEQKQFEGIVKGTIIAERRGTHGFGYDPVFIPEGYNITFAQMSAEEKNQISHRGLAVKKLVEYLKKTSFSHE